MQKRMISMKNRLKRGETVIGAWSILPSASVINVLAAAGLDFVIIDMEHGPHAFQTIEDMVRAAEAEDCVPLVRVAKNEEMLILRALDIGSAGVVVPHIESSIDAESAVRFAKYYPLGSRGFSSFTRAGRYSLYNVRGHSKLQNQKSLLVLMLEGREVVDSLEEILAIDNIKEKVDVIYIGAYDLSQAIGFPGQADHPLVKKRLKICINKINQSGIAAGGYVAKSKNDIDWMLAMGMRFITLLPDCTVLFHAYEALYRDFCRVNKKTWRQGL